MVNKKIKDNIQDLNRLNLPTGLPAATLFCFDRDAQVLNFKFH